MGPSQSKGTLIFKEILRNPHQTRLLFCSAFFYPPHEGKCRVGRRKNCQTRFRVWSLGLKVRAITKTICEVIPKTDTLNPNKGSTTRTPIVDWRAHKVVSMYLRRSTEAQQLYLGSWRSSRIRCLVKSQVADTAGDLPDRVSR